LVATNYSKDGTYWTARERANGYLEVVRIKAGGDYSIVESWGSYKKKGAAVGAAAELAYHQGRRDAAADLRAALFEALEAAGLGPSTASMAPPDLGPEESAKLGD
jgi:hypothetical protein